MWLLECPKAPASEHCLEVNLLKDPKHFSIFKLSFHSCETKSDLYDAF